MRIANLAGRSALVSDAGAVDIAKASNGLFPDSTLEVLERFDELKAWAEKVDLSWEPYDGADLGAPVPAPRQVFALAANYRDHAAEAGQEPPEVPYVFAKFPSCIVGPHDDVLLSSNRDDWEIELVVVIGRTCRNVAAEDAWSVVGGLTVGQDITNRRAQFRKPFPHLSVSKSYPSFGPTGPWITTVDELADPNDLWLKCAVNDVTMQDSTSNQLVFDVPTLIAEISSMVTLLPGDLIFTGTPAGVGSTRDPRRYLAPGDVITSEIEGLGTMRNACVEA